MTRFFGREGERSHLADALRSSEVRLVTLTGFGGCGKTRLSVEAAREVADTFPGGVWFVPLAELHDATRLFDVVGDTLGLPRATSAEQTLDQIAGRLNRENGRTLLVLDNFEQIVEEGATAVQTLLGRCPGLSCLVTSRHLLMLDGEQEISLMPLPTPTLSATPERLMDFSSVQLFVNRAQAARPDFQLTPRNATAVAQICARLEGIPLAIELAAAWSQTLTPAQMLERLGRRFDLLISRRRDIPVRQATLRATIEWSYKLLPPNLQTFFTQLSVFRGGWTLEAAEAITGNPDTITNLAELEQRSLLVTEETATASSMTFRMLEAVREFAGAQRVVSETGSTDTLQHRHAAFFADFAVQGEIEFHGPNAVTWLDRLESDHDNFRAALEWVLEHRQHIDLGLRIVAGLHRFWYIRGYLSEGQRWLRAVLAVPVTVEQSSVRAAALSAAAGLASAEGDSEAAGRLYTESLATYRASGNRRGIASSLCHLGLVISAKDGHAQARLLFEESLQISRELGDEGNAAHVLKCLGCNALAQGETEKAEPLFDESLAIYRRFGDKRGMAMVLGEIGHFALNYRNDPAGAADALEEHLRLSRQINDVVHTARALSGLGRLAQIQGNFPLAKKYLLESLNLFRARGYEREVLLLLRCFADLAVAQGQGKRAVTLEAAIAASEGKSEERRAEKDLECPEPPPDSLKEMLGQAAFEEAWTQGSRMTLDQAVTYTAGDE